MKVEKFERMFLPLLTILLTKPPGLPFVVKMPYLTSFNGVQQSPDEEAIVDETQDDPNDVPDHQGIVRTPRRESRTVDSFLLSVS